jgi:hypothetical protein
MSVDKYLGLKEERRSADQGASRVNIETRSE